ncbi:hypothetical protein L0152_24395, partial [bacterium]|nr:hypothetical protein [bacterium]
MSRHFQWLQVIENARYRKITFSGTAKEAAHGRVFPDEHYLASLEQSRNVSIACAASTLFCAGWLRCRLLPVRMTGIFFDA